MVVPAVNRVFLVRHARTALNAESRLRGHLDPPLDEVGCAEAAALSAVLGSLRPVRVLSSPLRRAVQTAEMIASPVRAELVLEKGLVDRDYGPWAGEREDSVIAEWDSLDDAPGVESADAIARRARLVLDAQIGLLATGPVVLVSHDAINRALLAQLDPTLGRAEQIPQRTACWNVLSRSDDHWCVDRVDQKAE